MPNTAADKKVKLSITPCKYEKGKIKVLSDRKPFEAMLNPSSWKRTQSINYDKTGAQGKMAETLKFSSMGSDKVSFSLLIDGTGVIEPVTQENNVAARIKRLQRVVYDYQSEQHEPRVVRIVWGTMLFFGRLDSMTLDYTLFKPSGDPLRAKIDLGFVKTMSAREESLEANRSSPDLTHEVTFKAGDSLPLLCQQIYGDDAYYTAVARYNRIVNFRAIPPGTTVFFPPLR